MIEFSKEKKIFSILFLLRWKPGITACGEAKSQQAKRGNAASYWTGGLPQVCSGESLCSQAVLAVAERPIAQATTQCAHVCVYLNTSSNDLGQSANRN